MLTDRNGTTINIGDKVSYFDKDRTTKEGIIAEFRKTNGPIGLAKVGDEWISTSYLQKES